MRFFNPKGIILNNIDYDHPDYFKTPADYFKVFSDFIKKIPISGWLIVNSEDELVLKAAGNCQAKVISYFIKDNNKTIVVPNNFTKIYYASNIKTNGKFQSFDLFCRSKKIDRFKISLPGRHNISNSLAVIAACLQLGLSVDKIKKNLATFSGAAQRFDILGKYKGAIIMNDYAHHPSEIKALLQAVKQRYPDKRIITIFHPHTFSRTEALIDNFSKSFVMSDDLYIVEIYSSAREKKGNISSIDLIEKIRQYNLTINKKQKIGFFKDLTLVEKKIPATIKPNDLILLLGAGDIFRVGYKWLKIKV